MPCDGCLKTFKNFIFDFCGLELKSTGRVKHMLRVFSLCSYTVSLPASLSPGIDYRHFGLRHPEPSALPYLPIPTPALGPPMLAAQLIHHVISRGRLMLHFCPHSLWVHGASWGRLELGAFVGLRAEQGSSCPSPVQAALGHIYQTLGRDLFTHSDPGSNCIPEWRLQCLGGHSFTWIGNKLVGIETDFPVLTCGIFLLDWVHKFCISPYIQ